MKQSIIIAALISMTLASPVLAQSDKPSAQMPSASDHSMPMGGMGGMKEMGQMSGMNTATMSPHAKEYMAAMGKMNGPMMEAMKAPTSDEAFVKGMIPHHQSAIDMANVALKYSKDERVKTWAQNVIREQSKEVAEFEAWLKTNASK